MTECAVKTALYRLIKSIRSKSAVKAGAETELFRHHRRKTGEGSIDGFDQRKRLFQNFFIKIALLNRQRIRFVLCARYEIGPSRKDFPHRTYLLGYMLDTVQNHIPVITKNQIAVLSHKFRNQFLCTEISQLISVLDGEN